MPGPHQAVVEATGRWYETARSRGPRVNLSPLDAIRPDGVRQPFHLTRLYHPKKYGHLS
jgi:hypothetical protein